MDKINELRKEIDECDKALVQTFNKRMELVTEVLEYKRKNNLPILHSKREQEVIEKIMQNLDSEKFTIEVESLYKEIFKISRRLQSKMLFPYNIVLIGFMGTGKTTIGKDLVKKLEMSYIDTDVCIEENMKMDIKEIFENYGEVYFRNLEKDVISEICYTENKIIICGGGVVLIDDNIKKLKQNGKIVLLEAEPGTILERIKNDDKRPVLKGRMSFEEIEKLIKKRDQFYKDAADIIIKTDDKSINDISNEIIMKLNNINEIS